MDSTTSTDDSQTEIKINKENILLQMIKEICYENDNKNISLKLKAKVQRIISDCDLTYYSSLHKLNTADESSYSTSTLLGLLSQTNLELTFDEQTELNQAIIKKIQNNIPMFVKELELLKPKTSKQNKESRKEQIQELHKSLDDKLNTLKEQDSEKVELMMEWLNHRLHDSLKFSENSSELLTLKTRILELKSTILHLHILQNIFTETNQSIKAYNEVHKDLKDHVKETELRIKKFNEIIESEFN